MLSKESVVSVLQSDGGRVSKANLVARFQSALECHDHDERARNRELFKNLVNSVAYVKRGDDGVQYVLLKKAYLIGKQQDGQSGTLSSAEREEKDKKGQEGAPENFKDSRNSSGLEQEGYVEHDSPETVASASKHSGQEEEGQQKDSKSWTAKEEDDSSLVTLPLKTAEPSKSRSEEESTEHLSPFELALQRSKYSDMRIKQPLKVEGATKPYALPLRMPPTSKVEFKPKVDPDEPLKLDSVRSKVKTSKESNESRTPSAVPLEHSEHEWLVKCASGQWSQVYGLLLKDRHLASKRDFMSGFTALHWAAKCGNSDMLVKILDASQTPGTGVDVNARSNGGYTALHVAALHRQDYVAAMLVGEYGANVKVRDNCGKRAYHYLHRDTAQSVKEMLGAPKFEQSSNWPEGVEILPELSKKNSISRIFQPHLSAQRRKHKSRTAFLSLDEEPEDQRRDSAFRQRRTSDAFA
ncbi:ankyrin repeat domain-containing protein SOWAHB-like [Corythoichthys intestinalis]|uniref:ankyrin repeat domain-containing protein SOWAHB-like n=1 Tax=Corythoichthys intestinalis TaxID=161448 RepID=UPI0025A5BF18|nr:ankyrin repeat domain-containing protein SOWAHB-like [Corythoichthys intestinalis]XP_061801170.1 ankyrin repeat domain-containing protein SOWAHB-like [Nerophis lumbriciformis]